MTSERSNLKILSIVLLVSLVFMKIYKEMFYVCVHKVRTAVNIAEIKV